jgi:hypothetical protein
VYFSLALIVEMGRRFSVWAGSKRAFDASLLVNVSVTHSSIVNTQTN